MISKSASNNIVSCHDKADKQHQAADPWHHFGQRSSVVSFPDSGSYWETILSTNGRVLRNSEKAQGQEGHKRGWFELINGILRVAEEVMHRGWVEHPAVQNRRQQSQDCGHKWTQAAKSAFLDLEPNNSWAGTRPFSKPRQRARAALPWGAITRAALAIFPQLLTTLLLGKRHRAFSHAFSLCFRAFGGFGCDLCV